MALFQCNLEVWNGLENRLRFEDGFDLKEALNMVDTYRRNALLSVGKEGSVNNILYQVIQHDEELDTITTVSYFTNTYISDDELWALVQRMPHAEFGVIYANSCRLLSKRLKEEERSKKIVPLTLKEANSFVKDFHRHHDSVTGCKFAIGLSKVVKGEKKIIGVAICGRPVSRILDNGRTLEINRVCVTEEGNCCSMLYGACCRIAKNMGYEKVITYTLISEPGTSLKASGFVLEDECCGGKEWNGVRKNTHTKLPPQEMKQRWAKVLV